MRSPKPRTRPRPTAIEAFAGEFGAKWPKAVAKIVDEKEQLLAFYEFPAEHWRHLRTTNPIESHVCSGEGEDGHHEGTGLEGGGSGDDLQAVGGSRREVEEAKRLSSGGAGESRSEAS